jgi:hypothetical protein
VVSFLLQPFFSYLFFSHVFRSRNIGIGFSALMCTKDWIFLVYFPVAWHLLCPLMVRIWGLLQPLATPSLWGILETQEKLLTQSAFATATSFLYITYLVAPHFHSEVHDNNLSKSSIPVMA